MENYLRLLGLCFPFFMNSLGAFAVFFGGKLWDGLVAALLGCCLRLTTWLLQKANMNQIFTNVVASFLLSLSAIFLVRHNLGCDPNKIIIGNIMTLIPGVGLTNALRDLFIGDSISGLLRLIEVVLIALAISAGYYYTVALRADGTAVAVGNNYSGQCNMYAFKNIVAITGNGTFLHLQ